MSRLLRAAVAVTATAVLTIATVAPAEAGYRETADPVGDLTTGRGCGEVGGTASVDIREVTASTYRSSHWRLRVTMRVAGLSKPVFRQRQVFQWEAYDRGESEFIIMVTRSVNRDGEVTTTAFSRFDPVPVKIRGNTVTVRSAVEPGHRFQLQGRARIEKDTGSRLVCTVRDTARRIGPLPTS